MVVVLTMLAWRRVEFPCHYLWIPLSMFRLKRSDEQSLLDKVASQILGWKQWLLNTVGHMALNKATLSPSRFILQLLYACPPR